jgi:hypothetical protein
MIKNVLIISSKGFSSVAATNKDSECLSFNEPVTAENISLSKKTWHNT